jgi:diguanylate cyclase (GGDEF)-like protein
MRPLDPVTLATYSAGVGTLLGFLSFVYWRTRHTYPGFGNWVGSVVFFAAAMVILTLRDLFTPLMFAVCPAVALLFSMALANRGARRFYGLASTDPVVVALLLGMLLALAWVAFTTTQVMTVHVVGAVGAALIALRTAWTFLRHAPESLRMAALMCASIFVLFALQRLLRIEFYLSADSQADLQRAVPASAFNYVINTLFTTFWAFSFFYLNTTRVELELKASREELLALSLTDPLTGVRNRRALYDCAQHEIARAGRTGEPVTLLMVDVDHFKKVNDQHGHPVGDQVLREVAAAIVQTARGSDVVARFGGEEFAVLLIQTEQAAATAERLRAAIARLEVRAPQGPVKVTVSIGVASASGESIDFEALIRHADDALYKAKREGRDRVVAA